MEEKEEKILYISTNGGEAPEKAAMPFVMGNAALAMDIHVTIVLQGNAVYLAQKGYVDHMLPGGGFAPIKKLMEDFIALGGNIWVCVPCIRERNIDTTELIEGVETTAAGKVNIAAVEADAVFTY